MKKRLFLIFTVLALAAPGSEDAFKIDFKNDALLKLERMAFYRTQNGKTTPLFLSRKITQRKIISGRPNGRKDKRDGIVLFDAENSTIKRFRYVKCDMLLHKSVFENLSGRVTFESSKDAVKFSRISKVELQASETVPGDFIRCSFLLDAGNESRCFRARVKPEPLKNSYVQFTGIEAGNKSFVLKKTDKSKKKITVSEKVPHYLLDKDQVVMTKFHARQLTTKAELEKTSFSDFWGMALLPEKHVTFVYPGTSEAGREKSVPRLGFAYKATIEPFFDPAKERIILKFIRSSFVTSVFVDGKLAGKSVESGLPIEFDITDFVKSGKKSELFIRTVGYDCGVLDEKGRGRFPFSGRKSAGGIARAVELKNVPAIRCGALAVSPAEGKVTLQGFQVNNSGSDVEAGVAFSITDGQEKVIFRSEKTVKLPAGKTVEVRHTFNIKDELKLWDIGSPNLYFARVTTTLDGEEIHCKRERFGYRYVELKGEDFYLNGRKVRLRGPWGHLEDWVGPRLNVTQKKRDTKCRPADTYRRLMKYGMNCGRLHRQIFPPEYYSDADEVGFLIIAESAFGHVWLPEKEVAAHLERFTKNFRNHPSVVVWSASNEFQLWVTPRPQKAMDFLNRMDSVIKKHDLSNRPVQHSGFGDANGKSDICNVHYSCDLKGLPRMYYWTRDPKKLTRHSYHDNFNRFNPKGKKPLFYGEHFNAHIIRDMHSAESGESGMQAFYAGARDSRMSQRSQILTGNVWRGHIRAAREQNVAMIAPIVFYCGVESEFIRTLAEEFKPQGAYPVFPMPVLTANERNVRRFSVFEDDGFPFSGKVAVTLEGNKIHKLIDKKVSLAGGELQEFDLPLDIPDITGNHQLVTRLFSADGKELYTDRVPVKCRRKAAPAGLGTVCKVWGNRSQIAVFAAKHGVTLEQADPDKLAGAILLIMPDVTEEELAARAGKLSTFISNGGKVLFFERQWKRNVLPGNIVFSQWDTGSGRGFVRDPAHPILSGMSDQDFFVWRKDMTISNQGVLKNVSGNIRVLIDGAVGLEQAFLWELVYGKGRVVVSHLPISETCMSLPQSEKLLLNILKSFSVENPHLSVPGLLSDGKGDFAGETFRKLGCSENSSGNELLIVTGNAVEKSGAVKVAETARKYKRVFLLNVPQKTLPELTAALGVPDLKTKAVSRKNKYGTEQVWFAVNDDPAYRGVSSGDLAWNAGLLPEYAFEKSSGWKHSIADGRDAWTTGRNGQQIRFINLAFDRDVTLVEKKMFFASQLLNNANCKVEMRQAADRVSSKERYFYVDLVQVANASRDEILKGFPTGRVFLGGIPFAVAAESRKSPFAMLRLTGREKSLKGKRVQFDTPWDRFEKFPGKVVIPLSNPQFESVSLLLTSSYNWKLNSRKKGQCAAVVRWIYRDGTAHEVPLIAGAEVPEGRKISAEVTRGEIVAKVPISVNAAGEEAKIGVTTVLNPYPEKKISRFEIFAADNPPYDLMVFGITCERTTKEYI